MWKSTLPKEIKIERLQEKLVNVKAIAINDEPKGGTSISQLDLLNDKIDYEKRLKKLKDLSVIYKEEITNVIDKLDDTKYIDVLELFFIDCLDFDDIANCLNFSVRYTITLYSKGIELISLTHH